MRIAIVMAVVILGLALAGPSHAQVRTPMGGGSIASQPNGGGGGGLGGGFSSSSGGHSLPALPAIHYANPSAHGTATDFQMTSFVPYEQALKMGEEALAQQTKTLGEIAAEYRAQKAQKHQ